MDYVVPVDNKVKIKESEKRVKYQDLARELKKTMDQEGDGDITCNWYTWNNTLRIVKQLHKYYLKARIDKMQQHSRCRLSCDRDETINHKIRECSKLAQREYKARHDLMGER